MIQENISDCSLSWGAMDTRPVILASDEQESRTLQRLCPQTPYCHRRLDAEEGSWRFIFLFRSENILQFRDL